MGRKTNCTENSREGIDVKIKAMMIRDGEQQNPDNKTRSGIEYNRFDKKRKGT